MFYQVDGNAATNSQFHATDSTSIVTGSVYFMQSPILILLCLRPVILKHAAFDGDFKMEVILNRIMVRCGNLFILKIKVVL
jgi:hypothetical protein